MTNGLLGRIRVLPLAAAACLALCSGAVTASPVLLGFTGGTNFPAFNGTNQTIGWSFTVAPGAGVTVTDLGWYDRTPASPLSQSHDVGIWDLTGLLLGSATVQTTGALDGDFRYAAATPFSLLGGATYIIGGAITSPFTDVYVSGVSGLLIDPMFTYGQAARSNSSSGFAAPLTLTANSGGRFGPNFEFTANSVQPIPEPSTLYIALTALGLLGAGRLRRAKTAA